MNEDILDDSVQSRGHQSVTFEPLGERANFALIAIGIASVLLLALAGISFWQASLVSGYVEGSVTEGELRNSDQFSILGSLLWIGILVLAAIAWSRWKMRASRNIHKLDLRGIQFTPGWTVGWYFVPFANLWMPYRAAAEIKKASRIPHEPEKKSEWSLQPAGWAINAWWTFWIVSMLIGIVSNYIDNTMNGGPASADNLITSLRLTGVAEILRAVSGFFAIAVIKQITKGQDTASQEEMLEEAPK